MIEIEKGKFLKINDNCYICNLCICSKGKNYKYVVAVNCCPEYLDWSGYEIFGYGDTVEEALIMSIGELVNSGLKGMSIDNFNGIEVKTFLKKLIEKRGDICSSEIKLYFTYEKGNLSSEPISVMLEGENCIAFLS